MAALYCLSFFLQVIDSLNPLLKSIVYSASWVRKCMNNNEANNDETFCAPLALLDFNLEPPTLSAQAYMKVPNKTL